MVSSTGASIIDAYGQYVKPGDDEGTIRIKVEQEVRRHSHEFEWHEDGSLSVTHVVPSKASTRHKIRRSKADLNFSH